MRIVAILSVSLITFLLCAGCSDQADPLGPKENVALIETGNIDNWPVQSATLTPSGTTTTNPVWVTDTKSIRFDINANGNCQEVGKQSQLNSRSFDVRPFRTVIVSGTLRGHSSTSGLVLMNLTLSDMTDQTTRTIQFNTDFVLGVREVPFSFSAEVVDVGAGNEGGLQLPSLLVSVFVYTNATDCVGTTWAEIIDLKVIGVPK